MCNLMTSRKNPLVLSLLATSWLSSQSFAQGANSQPSFNQRHSMSERNKKAAEMHTKMAECIEAGNAPAICRQDMIDACSNSFSGHCPMSEAGRMGGPGRGMMSESYMDWMMSPDSDNDALSPKSPSAKDAE